MGIYRWFKIAKLVYKLGAAARSGLGPFYLCHLQVQGLMCKVLWELWEPFATRHGDDCIAIAIGRHSSRSQHSKFVLRILCMDTVWNEIFTVIPTFVQSLRANCDLATILSSHFSGKLQQHMHCLGIYAKWRSRRSRVPADLHDVNNGGNGTSAQRSNSSKVSTSSSKVMETRTESQVLRLRKIHTTINATSNLRKEDSDHTKKSSNHNMSNSQKTNMLLFHRP